jgi:DNA-binding CsgD family transcriptional regulator
MANSAQNASSQGRASSHRGSSTVPGGVSSGGRPAAGRSVLPVTPAEKLEALLGLGLTSSEIAVSIGASVSAVDQRRRKLNKDERLSGKTRSTKADGRIDDLYSIVSTLEGRYFIEPENIRAWLIGRSAYLDEERPATLLADGNYPLVKKAAIAYATGETPAEFLEQRQRAGI